MGIEVEKDESQVEKVVERVENLQDKSLEIGIFGEDDSEILMIAKVNEYGMTIEPTNAEKLTIPLREEAIGVSPTEFDDLFVPEGTRVLAKEENDRIIPYYYLANSVEIPERRFIRGAYEEKQKDMAKQAQVLVEQYIHLRIDEDAFWSALGQMLAGMVQSYLTELDEPPNSSITVTNKGSSNPLVDTGRLRQAITYKVR